MRATALAGCLLLVATLASCAHKTTVEALLKDPAQFDRQKVAIEGTVKNPLAIFDYGAYEVDDGTGRLTVLAKKGGAPREERRSASRANSTPASPSERRPSRCSWRRTVSLE